MSWQDFLANQNELNRGLVARGGAAPNLSMLMNYHPAYGDGRTMWDNQGKDSYWGYKWDQDDKLQSLYGGYADAIRRVNELRLGKPSTYEDDQTKYWDNMAKSYARDAGAMNKKRYQAFASNPHPNGVDYYGRPVPQAANAPEPYGDAIRKMLK